MNWAILLPLLAGLPILYFWLMTKLNAKKWSHLIIESPHNSDKLFKQEVSRTVLALLIFSLIGCALNYLIVNDYSKVYTDINEHSYWYALVSLFLALALNDVYFYFSHRFLHLKSVFKRVHRVHHESLSPNPFTAFSFHWVEAIIQIGIVPIITLVIPIHVNVLIGFTAFMLFMSVYGHCGYELRAKKVQFLSVFNTSIHHHQHHRFVKYNFGLYLNFWDKVFKTNHPTYQKELESFKNK